MELTQEQTKMLDGEYGETVARQMQLLATLGKIYKAKRMIPIGSAQIAGVSYKSVGEPGLEFLEDIAAAGAKVKVLTSINPCGIDLEDWEKIGFPKDFAEKQKRIIEAFRRMGIMISVTCTPYFAGNLPRFSEHIAWSESSAVSFANSVIGARTNREGGPSALAAAICGVTPEYGFHLDDHRRPTVVVRVSAKLEANADFGALGYITGKKIQNKVPYFTGITSATTDNLKALGAAMAASGAVALYHVEGITPEAGQMKIAGLDVVEIAESDIAGTYATLNTGTDPDIIMIGCPHASLREIIEIAGKVQGRKLRKQLWICTSRSIKDTAARMGLNDVIEAAGGRLVADTCMVVSPIEQMGIKSVAVDSGKAANYLPGFCKQKVVFNRLDKLLE